MQLTIKLRIQVDTQAKQALLETMREYTASFNRVCQIGWQQPRINGVELHKQSYARERMVTDLPSQLICSARVKAVEALKSARILDKKEKKVSQPKSLSCPIRYDARRSTIKLAQGKAFY
jgi:putative transposase